MKTTGVPGGAGAGIIVVLPRCAHVEMRWSPVYLGLQIALPPIHKPPMKRSPTAGNEQTTGANGAADHKVFKRDILPRLQVFPLSVLMGATGLSESACSRVRAGQVMPHPRHWSALRALC